MKERRKRPEGWRTLRVGELELWWSVGPVRVIGGATAVAGEAIAQEIAGTIAVERADGSGKKLVVAVRARRAMAMARGGMRDAEGLTVEPEVVRQLVASAAPRGAWPTGSGTWRSELDVRARPLAESLGPAQLAGLKIDWEK